MATNGADNMSILYDLIFEMKADLQKHEQIRVEINENMGSIIRMNDKIQCINDVLIITRAGKECLIPLNHVLRVQREDRL